LIAVFELLSFAVIVQERELPAVMLAAETEKLLMLPDTTMMLLLTVAPEEVKVK
jgi:hypothetical protein